MDAAEFLAKDTQLFERLHGGSLDELSVRLKDGDEVRGHIVSIRRSGAIGGLSSHPTGELSLQTASGPVRIDYAAIESIA